MTDPRHARILARIAHEVAQQYTLTRSGSTSDSDNGNVPVPLRARCGCSPHETCDTHIDRAVVPTSDWNYTLPEEYQS